MFNYRMFVCGLALILGVTGINLAQKTKVDWDRDADFTKYQRYMWRGTIVLDLWDVDKKTVVWRGTVSDTLSDKPERNTKKIYKAVEKLFKKYPPKK